MNLRKRTTVAHRTRRPSAARGAAYVVVIAMIVVVVAWAPHGWRQWREATAPIAAVPDIPEGVLVIRHGTQIERYVAAEPTILCPDGTVRPMSNYRHICEPGWKQP